MTGPTTSSSKTTILYIDDEEDNLSIFKTSFKRDYQIYTALSAEEVLDILQKHEIHIEIADQRMPGTSGIEFFVKIVDDYPDTVRLLVTAYSEKDQIIKAINQGKIYHFLTKPWLLDELKIILAKASEYHYLKSHNRELISSLENKNDLLSKAVGELELFLYRSSHDLRGPIATQLGLLSLIKLESEKQHLNDYVKRIEQCTQSLAQAVDNFSKINAMIGADGISTYEVAVCGLIEEILKQENQKIAERKIETKVSGDRETKLMLNPELLKIVLENLIDNATRFSDTTGNKTSFIHIDFFASQSTLVIELHDNGIGIENKYLKRIFDPFFKINNGSGNGLGLFIVQRALNKLNGSIKFSSTFQEGTRVTLTIPVVTDENKLRVAS